MEGPLAPLAALHHADLAERPRQGPRCASLRPLQFEHLPLHVPDLAQHPSPVSYTHLTLPTILLV
eukprot:859284-Prorocentrum_minimum.AAC.1